MPWIKWCKIGKEELVPGTCQSKFKFSYNKLLSASAHIVKCLTKGQKMEPLYMPTSIQGHNNAKWLPSRPVYGYTLLRSEKSAIVNRALLHTDKTQIHLLECFRQIPTSRGLSLLQSQDFSSQKHLLRERFIFHISDLCIVPLVAHNHIIFLSIFCTAF